MRPRYSILKRPWFWLALLILIIISAIIYFLVFFPGIQVENIVISGNQKVASKDIENLVWQDINKNISKSIFLVNTGRLSRELINKFPTIERARVDKKFMQTIKLQIVERAPAAVFCPSKEDGEECYLIDKNGIAFEPLQKITQNIMVIFQQLNRSLFVGEKAIQQNIIDLLFKIEKDLKDNFRIDLREALVASSSRLNVLTSEGWQIYFDLDSDSDINSQLTKLNLLLTNEISQASRQNLRYIDLRPKDRAIICDNNICGK